MASSGQKRTRSERVAALELPPGQWERAWTGLGRRDVLGRIGLALLTALIMARVIEAWVMPFSYRTGYTPWRDIVAGAPFSKYDPEQTELARLRASSQVPYTYVRDSEPLSQLRAELYNAVVQVTAAETLGELDPELWREFQPAANDQPLPSPEKQEAAFTRFRDVFTGQENLDRFKQARDDAFAPFEKRGLLHELVEPHGQGNQEKILVHPVDDPEAVQPVRVSDVLIGDGTAVHESLRQQMESDEVADRLFNWLRPRLDQTATLQIDETAGTDEEMRRAAAAVEPQMRLYEVGQTLAEARQPLDLQNIELLELEYRTAIAERPVYEKIARATAVTVMTFAMFILCGIYMRYRQRGPLASLRRLSVIAALAVITVALARWASVDQWRAEIIPLLLFGMTMSIAYRQELGMLLTSVLSLVLVLAIGLGLYEFLLLLGVTATANLNMGTIRSRSKLIYVGLFAGAVAALLEIGLGMIDNQPFGLTLLKNALRSGLWTVLAGFLMTGLLPFVERLFGVLTDLSLLELGDVAHPLLQELVRRAPSTYNHSVTVGSISEAAAESIGARGLLVRVGAYFHDIGKMLKPGYFIENQGNEENRHETLVPAMSSLVIVAHIKDGADLARQHHLPQPIVDLIQQHHGTTRVGFFYERATQQQQSNPDASDVDESMYRYPGPMPQTKEAGVLMLADAVESASRTLVDPTPARIESLVREVAQRRLHGGQFDESGLTLRELRTIERTMVKSLTAIYHGRLKYPDQQTA